MITHGKTYWKLLFLLLPCFMFMSCATIFCKKQTILVDSNVAGASVYIDGNYKGKTPLRVKARGYTEKITVSNGDNYDVIYPSTKTNHIIWLNLIYPPGFLVDLATGKYLKFRDKYFYAHIKSTPTKSTNYTTNTPTYSYLLIEKKTQISSYYSNLIRKGSQSVKITPQEIYKKCEPAVFVIKTDRAQGSGFFIASNIGVTNYHVLKNVIKGREKLITHEGEFNITEIIACDEQNDYVVFKTSGSHASIPVTLKNNPEIGEKVFAISSPLGFANTFSDGMVSSLLGYNQIQISVPIDHGSSGGALINEYGEVIGITSGGIDSSNAQINYAVNIRAIFR